MTCLNMFPLQQMPLFFHAPILYSIENFVVVGFQKHVQDTNFNLWKHTDLKIDIYVSWVYYSNLDCKILIERR